MFVVWRTVGKEQKGHIVVDICALNKLVQRDAYPVSIQQDILALIKDSKFIFTINCTSFFYQWHIFPEDRHKLIVISHQGQEMFSVIVMRFINSSVYIQRMIDKVLRKCQTFSRAYIDDIIIYAKIFQEHIQNLEHIFMIFKRYNIAIKASKSFLLYLSVTLLG